ncbi:MAG: hypothetical protein RL607_805 [Bacteroidota bacterium]|jgi:hypothetical protein
MKQHLLIMQRENTAYVLEHLFIPFLIVSVIALIFIILYYRFTDDHRDKNQVVDKNIIELFLIRFLFEGLTSEERIAELAYYKNSVIKDDVKLKRLLIEQLVHIQKNIQDTPKELIHEIALAFDLYATFNRQLKYGNTFQKINAIQYSQIFNNQSAIPYLKPLLDSKTFEIRTNVLKALMVLSGYDSKIITSYPHNFKEIELLMLADLFIHQSNFAVEKFDSWLDSENENIILLSLMIIQNIKYYPESRKLQLLILHENKTIASKALSLLMYSYKKETSVHIKGTDLFKKQGIGSLIYI